MRKVLALLLSLLMLTPALAEETAITPLPMGLTDTGYTPDPNAFIAADEENGVLQGYQDDSITVTLWRETVGDATYNIARVKIADPSQFRTGLNHPKARTDNKISAIAEKHNAVVAIGGDYFGKDDYGYVVRMNEVFRKKPSKQRDMLLVDSNGDFHIILQSDADELKALLSSDTLTFPNVFNFGPALVVDGNVCEIPDYYKNKYNVLRMNRAAPSGNSANWSICWWSSTASQGFRRLHLRGTGGFHGEAGLHDGVQPRRRQQRADVVRRRKLLRENRQGGALRLRHHLFRHGD